MNYIILFTLVLICLLLICLILVICFCGEKKIRKVILLDTENINKTPKLALDQLAKVENEVNKLEKTLVTSPDSDVAKSEKLALQRIVLHDLNK